MKQLSLTTKIFIGLAAGLAVGLVINLMGLDTGLVKSVFVEGICEILGTGFLRLMKMLVVPLVFCSLVCGAASMGKSASIGKVGFQTILFYLLTTTLAVLVAMGTAALIRPGLGLSLTAQMSETTAAPDLVQTILDMIPENPVQSLAQGNMLQVIVFALLVGYLLGKMGEKGKRLLDLFEDFNHLMMDMTLLVMKLAPLGIFAMLTKTFAGIGFEAFAPLLKYIITVLIALALQLAVYLVLLFLIGRLNPMPFLKKFFPVMAFAFSTSSSNAVIPLNIETLENDMGVKDNLPAFTIPLGATINMDGTSIMQGVAVLFAAQAYGILLGPSQYLTIIATATLASIGTAGIPGVGLVTLSMVFSSVGIPTDAIALIMGIDRILDMARTAVNITGDAACTCIVASRNNMLDKTAYGTLQNRQSI